MIYKRTLFKYSIRERNHQKRLLNTILKISFGSLSIESPKHNKCDWERRSHESFSDLL